jgi:hypothetical protein
VYKLLRKPSHNSKAPLMLKAMEAMASIPKDTIAMAFRMAFNRNEAVALLQKKIPTLVCISRNLRSNLLKNYSFIPFRLETFSMWWI